MDNVFDILKERGFIAQVTHEEEVRELLGAGPVTFYIGFDPTADSLHIGHFLQLMVMSHMQRAGHRPIALLGGGTAMVGDPTGKTDMRQMMTQELIQENAKAFKKQMQRFLVFSEGKAVMVDNAEWLLNLKYVEFLREIGVHFSVNRMLTAECFKARLERGLSFLEFNYMLMQGYDFLELFRRYGCRLQLGGDDQWSNIINGADLIRRVEGESAYGMTFNLLTTGEGKKMGKTERGAVWLDPEKTSPYDFYQHWRNVDDGDVAQRLAFYTFLPMDEVRRLSALKGEAVNEAKEVLAYEVTKLVHGEPEADNARKAAQALFGAGGDAEVPGTVLSASEFASQASIVDLLAHVGLAPSKGEARRLVNQGGIYVNDERISDIGHMLTDADIRKGAVMIRKGKKVYFRIQVEG